MLKSWYSDQKKLVKEQLAKRHEEMHCLSKISGVPERERSYNIEDIPLSTRVDVKGLEGVTADENPKIVESEQSHSQGQFKLASEAIFERLDKPKKVLL